MFDLVITSGGFDPLHIGHLEYLSKAKNLTYNTHHICIVNNDEFLKKKKGFACMCQEDRAKILYSLRFVDEVFLSEDLDMSVCDSIKEIAKIYRNNPLCRKIIFAKGGDRFADEVPELGICTELGIEMVSGLGEKIRSSSKLVKRSDVDVCTKL